MPSFSLPEAARSFLRTPSSGPTAAFLQLSRPLLAFSKSWVPSLSCQFALLTGIYQQCAFYVFKPVRFVLIILTSSVSIASRVPVIAADIIVLFVTWMKTAKQARHASLLQMGVSLSETLLRDGTVPKLLYQTFAHNLLYQGAYISCKLSLTR